MSFLNLFFINDIRQIDEIETLQKIKIKIPILLSAFLSFLLDQALFVL